MRPVKHIPPKVSKGWEGQPYELFQLEMGRVGFVPELMQIETTQCFEEFAEALGLKVPSTMEQGTVPGFPTLTYFWDAWDPKEGQTVDRLDIKGPYDEATLGTLFCLLVPKVFVKVTPEVSAFHYTKAHIQVILYGAKIADFLRGF